MEEELLADPFHLSGTIPDRTRRIAILRLRTAGSAVARDPDAILAAPALKRMKRMKRMTRMASPGAVLGFETDLQAEGA